MKKYLLLSCAYLFLSTQVFANEAIISCSYNSRLYGLLTEVYKINEDTSIITTSGGNRYTKDGETYVATRQKGTRFINTINEDIIELSAQWTIRSSGKSCKAVTTINRITGEFNETNDCANTDDNGTCQKATHRF